MGGTASKSPHAPHRVFRPKYYDEVFESLPSMQGKTVAVTGCTTGTGFIAARAVVQKGGEVLLLNRASARATTAEEQIKAAAAPGAKVHSVECDLSDFASVRKAAAEVKRICPKGLNVLCNNAGVMALADKATKDGYDIQMQTNHLSHFLLTKELWPLLKKKAADARVINHTSVARNHPNKPLEAKYLGKNGGNLGGDPNPGGFRDWMCMSPAWERYQQTKLASAVFSLALHEKLQAKISPVKSLLAHPGVCSTELMVTTATTQGYPAWWSAALVSLMGQSAEDGALPLMKCIFNVDTPSGTFFGTKRYGSGPPVVQAPRAGENMFRKDGHALLWKESEAAVGAFKL